MRYRVPMLRYVLPLLIAFPAFAQDAHSSVPATRSMPELSDIALFVCAVFGVWFVRRSLRARFRNAKAETRD